MTLLSNYLSIFLSGVRTSAWRLLWRPPVWTVVLVCCLLLAGPNAHAFEAPLFVGDVLDEAGLLSEADRSLLQERIRTLRDTDNIWAALYITRSLQQFSIEEAAVATFEKWKIGQKGQDNGVLILIAPNERKTRIEVGYGLEGMLTDAISKRIIDEVFVPAFREQRYTEAIMQGFEVMAQRHRGESGLPEPPLQPAPQEVSWDGAGSRFLWVIGLNLVPPALYGGAMLYGRRRRRISYESGDFRMMLIVFGFIGFVFGLFYAVFGAAFPDDPEIGTGLAWGNALFAAVFGIPFLLKALHFASGKTFRRQTSTTSSQSNADWGTSSSSISSSSSDSSSSSSGGGSSGGGGASGDW